MIERWDALLRYVPRGMALGAVIGREESEAGSDPVSWLSEATSIPRHDLDQLRLLRVYLGTNKEFSPQVLTRALDTLNRAHRTLEGTHVPE